MTMKKDCYVVYTYGTDRVEQMEVFLSAASAWTHMLKDFSQTLCALREEDHSVVGEIMDDAASIKVGPGGDDAFVTWGIYESTVEC